MQSPKEEKMGHYKKNAAEKVNLSSYTFPEKRFCNAWHPSPNRHATEWWYFSLLAKNKTVISVCLTLAGTPRKNLEGQMWLSVYREGKKPIEIYKTGCRKFMASTEKCDVRIENNHFFEKDGRYYARIDEKGVKLEISGRPLFHWNENILEYRINSRSKFQWIVPVLRGNFTGELQVGPEKERLDGTFFHDHVLANIYPSWKLFKNFNGWLWGLCYTENSSLLFVKVDARTNPFLFICREKNGKVVKESGAISLSENMHDLSINGEAILKYDNVMRVQYYHGKRKLLRFFFDLVLRARKYHAYSSQGGAYMECMLFRRKKRP